VTSGPAGADAVLVIRVWYEPGPPPGLRARVIGADLDDPSASVALASRDDVIDTVGGWLDGWWRATPAP
jgi:hypothetical protein